MTRFIHIGDFHAQANAKNEQRYAALDSVIAAGLKLDDLGAWLWPGDLDHARMGIDDKNALALRVQTMANHAPVVICYGNHDLPGDLDFLSRLAANYTIYVIATPQVLRIGLAVPRSEPPLHGAASIFVLPYPTKAGLAAQGLSPDEVFASARQQLDYLFIDAAAKLEDARKNGDLTLMVGHVNVSGSITSVGQPNIGREIEIDPVQLARFGDIYIGLNHIHKGQSVGRAHYPGSICRLDWGEIEPKAYLEIACGKDYTPSGHIDVIRRPIDVPPMYHVEGDLSRNDFVWKCTAGPGGDQVLEPACACLTADGAPVVGCTDCCGSGVSWKGCEVRVRYKFKQSERSILRDAIVKACFVGALNVEYEPVCIPDRALRSPEVAAARTITEKFVAWATVNGLRVTDGMIAKLAALEHGDHLHAISELEHALSRVEEKHLQKVMVAA
jgi:hypothetical protein